MNLTKNFLIGSIFVGTLMFGLTNTTSSEASLSHEMTLREVQAIFRDKMENVTDRQASRLARQLVQLCKQYQFSPAYILSLIQVESGFRPKAVSPVGAIGLMQIMPNTAKEVVTREGIPAYRGPSDLKDPVINLKIGVSYLAQLRKRFNQSAHHLAAYNLGPTKFQRMTWKRARKIKGVYQYVRGIQGGQYTIRNEGRRLISSSGIASTRSS